MKLSTDVDVFKREAVMYGELLSAGQKLAGGNDGMMAGSTFTSAGAAFTAGILKTGHMLHVDGGNYEIVSVDGPTQLTVSVVRLDEDDPIVAPQAGSVLTYSIVTFDAQAEFIAEAIIRYFGIGETAAIMNPEALREASVYGVLASVFTAMALPDDGGEVYLQKAALYRRLFEQARIAARVQVDTDGDGIVNEERQGGSVRLQRL